MTADQTYFSNPYVGPRAFEERDGARFFGRERELEEVFHLLLARRLVLLHSPSGAGKSSLIQARLIPRLRDEGFMVHPPIRLRGEAPAGANRFTLATLLSLGEPAQTDETTLHDLLGLTRPAIRLSPTELASLSLSAYLARRPPPEGEEVFIFDQFEEVLSLDPADQATKQAFFAQLGAMLEDPRRWALFAIREDYLGALRPYLLPIPTRLAATYRLDLLDPSQAMQAIQGPARDGGGAFSDAAAARLVDDLRETTIQRPDGSSERILGNAIEPVQLQVVCYRLWARKMDACGNLVPAQELPNTSLQIDVADLEAAGSVDEALAGYYAERVAVAGRVIGANERSVRTWVEQELITADHLRGQVLRQAERTAGLPNGAIQVLVDAHLLRAEERRGAVWYELAHDRLLGPIRSDNAAWREANLSTLQRQAALWEDQRRPEGLLLRGAALRQAETEATDLNEVEQAFLAACQTARVAEEREQRQTRRMRGLAVAALTGLVLALILAGVAWVQIGVATREASLARTAEAQAEREAGLARTAEAQAENQLRISNAQRLVIAAQSLPAEPALQLAYEAYALDQSSITEFVLHELVNQRQWEVISLEIHAEVVGSAVFSPNGQRILAALADGTARLWDSNGEPVATLRGHTDRVNSAVFSPDGSHILTASGDGTARLWDADGQTLATLTGHTDAVNNAIFAPDGGRIVTTSEDGTARLWDADGQPLATLQGHNTDTVGSAVFAPDGTRILTIFWDDNVAARLWSTDGQLLATLTNHFDPESTRISSNLTNSAVFAPDGLRILTGSVDGTAQLWDAEGQPLVTLAGHTDALFSVVFSPDGSRILTASIDRTARLWSADGQPIAVLTGHTNGVISGVFSPDGNRILTASRDGTARLWNADGNILETLTGHTTGEIRSAVFSPDGAYILTTSSSWGAHNSTIRLWREVIQPLPTLVGHTGGIRSAVFSPDGSRIVTASWDSTARLWQATGQLLTTLDGHTGYVWGAVFSPDGSRILTASWDNTARLWDITGQPLTTLEGHRSGIWSAVFSPDGKRILTASDYGDARLWNTDGQLLSILEGRYSAAFSPDGSRMLTAFSSWGNTLYNIAQLWDADGQPITILEGHTDTVYSTAFSPDGSRMLTASADGTARLWDADGQPLSILTGHSGSVRTAKFSPDGTLIVTASDDGTARLWDADGQPLAVLTGHTGLVYSAVFSPDGRRVLTASSDGTARQYLVYPEDLLAAAACRIGRALTAEEIERYNVPQPLQLNLAERNCPPRAVK
ncbi:MAG: hypothetical protein EI684_19850 [Candidatus Viridilinea halotolerans]|uniref:Novel STAND NTPase 1 domain-containing protein n=1 Tax=Candidatus Viridilinea halotolerans TaxID=2491704 RepID=A0A426TSE3_9CHLR|nr:MAG: hypothetical protein EI684_19850 [Candidatus Viridilinea halotolerans]